MMPVIRKKQLIRFAAAAAGACLLGGCVSGNRPAGPDHADPNDYSGSDSERINAAVRDAGKYGGVVRIGRRKADEVSDRDYWLLDSAILIPVTNSKSHSFLSFVHRCG